MRIGIGCILFFSLVSCLVAQERKDFFEVQIDSDIHVVSQGKENRVGVLTQYQYSLLKQKDTATLFVDAIAVESKLEGKTQLKTEMNAAQVRILNPDNTWKEMKVEDVKQELKEQMQAIFGRPICKIFLSPTGKELKREILAVEGARQMIENGMISHTRFFHPPFEKNQESWEAPTQWSLGNGGFLQGNLRYRKMTPYEVQFSGTLKGDWSSPRLKITDAVYEFEGRETYDPQREEWISGTSEIQIRFGMTLGKRRHAKCEGKIRLNFAYLNQKEQKE